MSNTKKGLFFALMLVLLLASAELLFYATGRVLEAKWLMWGVPGPPEGATQVITYQEYLKRRDPVLGWPYPMQYGKDLDTNGAQRNPFFPHGPEGRSCVSLYGDSFTRGGDTSSPERNWGNVLSKRLGCYVANFGVGGYGTDQAYLRFRENSRDTSPVVIFGIHPADVARNLTRVRDLENRQKWFALKPRFVVDDGGRLVLIPIPDLTENQYEQVIGERPGRFILEQEDLAPGGPAGVVNLEFPYSVSVVKNMLRYYGFRSRLLGYPEWMELLERGHPLHGLEITSKITQAWVDLAKERGRIPLVLMLPHPADFAYFKKKAEWPYHTLTEDIRRSGIAEIDFGPFLLSRVEARGGNLAGYFGATRHYNDEGNALVAEFVYGELLKRGSAGADASFPQPVPGQVGMR